MPDDPRFSSQPQPVEPSQYPGPMDPPVLPFGEKISLALSLTKSHALTLFLVMLAGWIVIYILFFLAMLVFGLTPFIFGTAAEPSGGALAFMFLGIFLTSLVVGFLGYFFMIGVNSLTLQYVDGERPASIIATVMSPWARFGSIVLCVLMWLLVNIAFQIAATIVGLIPILGWLAALAGLFILSMAMMCALFYLADREEVRPVESVTLPFKMVTSNWKAWLVAMLTALVAYIPAGLVAFLVIMAAAATESVVVMLLAGFLALACFVAVSVFALFFMALTYRQTRGGYMAAANVFN